MKFIHTSDWHLGRQFHNVSLIDDQKIVLQQLIDYIKANPVDAVIVAGDIYDRSIPPTAAIELLDDTVKQICGTLQTPMILISGNHDSAERLGFGAEQMRTAGLHIISNFEDMLNPVILHTEEAGDVAFYGMPFSGPEIVKHKFQQDVSTFDEAHQLLAEKIKSVFKPSQKNVLVSHCFVDGAIESDSERPLSIGGSDRVSHTHFIDFDYVALGHLHQPQKKGADHIRYSGSLMKYSFSEQHQKKGVTLVEMTKQGAVATTHISLTAPHEMRIIEGELEHIIEQGKTDPRADDYLLVRLTDKHAILNPMDKLRVVYPNVLHLEKPGMLIGLNNENDHAMSQAKLARNELDMFRDFYLEAQKNELSVEQINAIATIVKQLGQG